MTTSSLGSQRARRREKSQLDLDTQHRLWFIRLMEQVAAGDHPRVALDKLTEEVRPWISEIPQRKTERQVAWSAFLRKIPAHPNT
jgi:hypothetical protein